MAHEQVRERLIELARRCVRPPTGLLGHAWLAPMPSRGAAGADDGFAAGDYSLALFHHDASEASIELLGHPDLREAAAGSLLCLLDAQAPSGCVWRTLLPHKAREAEPARPVLAQWALRATDALGAEWADEHRLVPRLAAWLGFLEREYVGLHGLFLTHSSLASGFDNDPITAGLPDKSVAGPDTNAFVVLEYRALAELERRLGGRGAAWDDKARALARRMDELLWCEDDRGGFYAGLRFQYRAARREDEIVSVRGGGTGAILQWASDAAPVGAGVPAAPASGARSTPVESWIGLLPLYAGIPSAERADAMIRRLLDPAGYWGPQGVRTVPRWSPFFHQAPRVLHFDFKKGERGPVSNWSGPVWVLSSFYLASGLARYGRLDAARELSERTIAMLDRGLRDQGGLFECYDDEGRGLWPEAGTFASWNVLALTMARTWALEAAR